MVVQVENDTSAGIGSFFEDVTENGSWREKSRHSLQVVIGGVCTMYLDLTVVLDCMYIVHTTVLNVFS
jgi:hypothetical protein